MDSIAKLDKEKMYCCRICNFDSMQLHDYMKHITTHVFQSKVIVSQDTFYHCDKCRCAFLTDNALKLHRMAHVIKAVKVKEKKHEARYLDEKYVKRYSCSECDYKFVLKSTLDMHMEAHKPLKHVCSCGIAYYEKKDLNSHKKLVHKNIILKEAKTEKITKMPAVKVKLEYASDLDESENNFDLTKKNEKTSKNKFKIEVEVETEQQVKSYYKKNSFEIISCNNCDQTFTVLDMRKHVEEMHKNVPYSCRCCYLRFAKKELVEEHRNNVHRTRTCNICRKKFVTKASLDKHMFSHNPNSRPRYVCPICKKRYAQQASLNVHLLRHKGEKCFGCKTCSKKFYDRHALQNHERTHTGDKPYVCQYCNKAFSDPSAHIRHVRIHTKEYRYFCTECPKKFTDASSMIRHKHKHGKGQKDLKVNCDICGKSISNIHNLKKHKLVMHEDIKMFQCHDCGQKFSSKGNVFMHIQNKHSERPECAYCGKKVENKKALQRHKDKHHPIILYCSSCPQKFHREDSFQKHKLVCSQRNSEKKD
ncbi:zinc finger protein 99-like [Aricia agestis]|uniref:zinc finger protein 99-like n=1 Tax=Aricia agestis TaxID=91739 RepID=UPI001C20AA81|nr:zinc finger protein 99-like [Aricia agestis]XP_041978471.1 zinc finger protein 99-like [Aricia agestis]XP_041978473.1 zinc finger protein 99-like [Aricia agestis]